MENQPQTCWGLRVRRDGGRVRAGAAPIHQRVRFRINVRQGGNPKVYAHFGGDAAQDVAVSQGPGDVRLPEWAQAAFPVDKGPVLFHCGGHRQNHVGVGHHCRVPHFEANYEGRFFESGARLLRVGPVTQVNATNDEGAELASSGTFNDPRSAESLRSRGTPVS